MKTENEGLIIAEEVIISKIYYVRGKQVWFNNFEDSGCG
jgi:hypothetical protein